MRSFNPQPAGKPAATRVPRFPGRMTGRFNPQPAGKPAATSPSPRSGTPNAMFQSSAGREPAATAMSSSIIAMRSCFNPQPAGKPAATAMSSSIIAMRSCFNPQPAGKPAATWSRHTSRSHGVQFQSSAGRKAGCDPTAPALALRTPRVSILSRPGSRLRHPVSLRHQQPRAVSILSRPGSRLRRDIGSGGRTAPMFQSSAGREAGCDLHRRDCPSPRSGFNPQPAGKPAATRARSSVTTRILPVSILSRPGSRLRPLVSDIDLPLPSFQSSAGREAGCDLPVVRLHTAANSVSILSRPGSRLRP